MATPFSPLSWQRVISHSVFLCVAGRSYWRERGLKVLATNQIIRPRESLAKSFNTLWFNAFFKRLHYGRMSPPVLWFGHNISHLYWEVGVRGHLFIPHLGTTCHHSWTLSAYLEVCEINQFVLDVPGQMAESVWPVWPRGIWRDSLDWFLLRARQTRVQSTRQERTTFKYSLLISRHFQVSLSSTVNKDWKNQLLYCCIWVTNRYPDPLLLVQWKKLTSVIADALYYRSGLRICGLAVRHIWKCSSLAGDYFL